MICATFWDCPNVTIDQNLPLVKPFSQRFVSSLSVELYQQDLCMWGVIVLDRVKIMSKFTKIMSKIKRDHSGQISVIFAIALFPMLVMITFVTEHAYALSMRQKMEGALDSAALAAVLDQTLTVSERETFAKAFFWDAYGGARGSVAMKVVEANPTRVELSATGKFRTSVSAAIGVDKLTVTENAVAKLTSGQVICMLALDPHGEASLDVRSGATLLAPTCSVQVNSDHKFSTRVDHGGMAMAKDFCTRGGSRGKYEPYMNTECSAVKDPYENLIAPAPDTCVDQVALDKQLSTWQAESVGITLKPGTYCGGLNLRLKVVTFEPGTYIMKDGPLELSWGTQVKGEGVTFVLHGKDSYVKVTDGASISISAPKTGDLAGLAIFQDVHNVMGKQPKAPVSNSIINSGGAVNIVGTAYLPTQKMTFIEGSLMASQAPATSFIAYNIELHSGASVEVAVDHQKAGLPPMEPRSDEAARLVE